MGLIRKTLSISLTGGLIGYRSGREKVERNIRLTAKATRQTAGETRYQNELIAHQNDLIEDQTDAIIRQQQIQIAQQAEALRIQSEQLRALQGPVEEVEYDPEQDPVRLQAREATLERIRVREEEWRRRREL